MVSNGGISFRGPPFSGAMLVFWVSTDSLSQDAGSWQVKVYRLFIEIPEPKHVIDLGGDFLLGVAHSQWMEMYLLVGFLCVGPDCQSLVALVALYAQKHHFWLP